MPISGKFFKRFNKSFITVIIVCASSSAKLRNISKNSPGTLRCNCLALLIINCDNGCDALQALRKYTLLWVRYLVSFCVARKNVGEKISVILSCKLLIKNEAE